MAKVKWSKLKAEYIAGTMSYRKLAEAHGISFDTLKEHAVPEGWYKLRQQNCHKKTTEIVDAINSRDIQKALSVYDVADTLLRRIDEMAAKVHDPDSIRKLASAVKDIKDIKDIKSDADAREQEAKIERIRAACNLTDGEDKNTGVVLLPSVTPNITTPEDS